MSPDLKRILNRAVSMRKVLLTTYGVTCGDSAFSCPFPDHGSVDNTPSAQLFDDTNKVYCYAEERMYSVYDALSAAGHTDAELTSFIVNSLGGETLSHVSKDDRTLATFQESVSTYLEGRFSQYRRGDLSWQDMLPAIQAYFDNINQESE